MRWRRENPPGDDSCALQRTAGGWELRGRARFTQRRTDHVLHYQVHCDRKFRTRDARAHGTMGGRPISRRVAVKDGRWYLDRAPRPQLDGCVDIDLAFTPSTNLLPIRRLRLEVGQSASVKAAWLRFPQFDLRPLPQTYRRASQHTYDYRSGDLEARLSVDRRGFVVDYGGLWIKG